MKITTSTIKLTTIFIVLLLSFTVSAFICLKISMLNEKSSPFVFFEFLENGYWFLALLTLSFVLAPLLSFFLYLKGGIERLFAIGILGLWIGLIIVLFCANIGLSLSIQGPISASPEHLLNILFFSSHDETIWHITLKIFLISLVLIIFLMVFPITLRIGSRPKILGDAHFCSTLEVKKQGLYAKEGIILGTHAGKTIRISGNESVLVNAPTGSGKTRSIAVPNLLEWKGSSVVNDLKGELFEMTAKHREKSLDNTIFCFSPAKSSTTTHRFNPFFYVRNDDTHLIRDLQLIAQTIIPDSKHGDAFWHHSSRDLFLGLSLFLFEKKGSATLAEIHDLSKQEQFFLWIDSVLEEDTGSITLRQLFSSLAESDEKTRSNILKDFHSRMSLYQDPMVREATSNNDFDFTTLRSKKQTIYIHIPVADKERLTPLLTLFWAQLIQSMTRNEPSECEPFSVLAVLDEFGNLSKINPLREGMSFLRSYHLRCLVLVQYLSQITSVYGVNDSKGFLNAKVKVTFTLNDRDDAHYFSKSLGQKTITVTNKGFNSGGSQSGSTYTKNITTQSQPLMRPESLMTLSKKEGIALIEGCHPVKIKKSLLIGAY